MNHLNSLFILLIVFFSLVLAVDDGFETTSTTQLIDHGEPDEPLSWYQRVMVNHEARKIIHSARKEADAMIVNAERMLNIAQKKADRALNEVQMKQKQIEAQLERMEKIMADHQEALKKHGSFRGICLEWEETSFYYESHSDEIKNSYLSQGYEPYAIAPMDMHFRRCKKFI